jgi:hypothetical protein
VETQIFRVERRQVACCLGKKNLTSVTRSTDASCGMHDEPRVALAGAYRLACMEADADAKAAAGELSLGV